MNIGKITEADIQAEMSWLRCIDMDSDKDVRRAAIEILNINNTNF